MSREALVLLVCCCDFRDGAERLIPSKSLRNAVIRAFPGLLCILRMCAPRRAAAVVRPRGREKSADRRRRILISRLLIIRASVPRWKSPFPAYFKGFPAVSPLIPPYPAFLKYPVSPHCIMELKLRVTGEDDPKKQEWVQLPASQIKLERAMLRAGIPSCGEMQMLVSDSRFPDEVDCTLDVEHGSLFELNRLCQICSNFKEQDFVKLGAVCQMAKPTCAANIRQLAENLDQFDFAPNVHTPEELGKYMIQQSGHYEYDENLEDFYNYGDYGVKRILQDNGVFVDRGYVSYHGTLTLDELMQEDLAEGYQQEQDVRMEGMAW